MSVIGGNLLYPIPDLHERGWKDENDLTLAMLDRALAGTTPVTTTGGNTTIPMVPGVLDEGRALRLTVEGVLTSDAHIYLPTVSKKLWLLGNFTTGAFKVYFHVSTSNFEVLGDRHQWAYTDGVNLLPISSVPQESVGTPELVDLSVTNAKLGPAAITYDKMGPNSVNGDALAEDTVLLTHLAPGTAAQILAGQTFPAKFASALQTVGNIPPISHGITSPTKGWAELVCIVADGGHNPGDVASLEAHGGCIWNAATIAFYTDTTVIPIRLIDGSLANLTPGSWHIRLKVF
jgi:hypothetical protein